MRPRTVITVAHRNARMTATAKESVKILKCLARSEAA